LKIVIAFFRLTRWITDCGIEFAIIMNKVATREGRPLLTTTYLKVVVSAVVRVRKYVTYKNLEYGVPGCDDV
jgi:hypothetical protein